MTRSLRLISIALLICIGLLQAQWQGFVHAIEHAHHTELVVAFESNGHPAQSNQSKAEQRDFHHCAAYDSLTLAYALTATLEAQMLSDAKHVAEEFYQSKQASIEAYSAFDARGPPNNYA